MEALIMRRKLRKYVKGMKHGAKKKKSLNWGQLDLNESVLFGRTL